MRALVRAGALGLIFLSQVCVAQAQSLWQPFSAMAIENGYRFTAVQQDGQLLLNWRPFDHTRLLETIALDVESEKGALEAVPGSARQLLRQVATIFVVLDPSDKNRLYDELVALRSALAEARFERQRWEIYRAGNGVQPIAVIASEDELGAQWLKLRALLTDADVPPLAGAGGLSQHLSTLATRSGDRKALVVPQSLMPALAPGLNEEGLAALQAFGISLYPLTYSLDADADAAFSLLAGVTGGRVLTWLDIPPSAKDAASAFLPLSAGGSAVYDLPQAPMFPWQSNPPVVVTLSAPDQPILSMVVPVPSGRWSALPWPVLAGFVGALAGLAALGALWVKRTSAASLNAVLIDVGSGKHYPVRRWPATLGRSKTADITIANANLAPEHARLRAVSGVAELSLMNANKRDLIIGGQSLTAQMIVVSTDFTLAGVPFRLEVQSS
ncbi:MAG: FHA domain-containing protein [Pseudomonadota bacterium]